MPRIVNLDELNTIQVAASPSFSYFDQMNLSLYEKRKRKRLAAHIYEMMLSWFYFYITLRDFGIEDRDYLIQALRNRFRNALSEDVVIDEYLEKYLDQISPLIVDATTQHTKAPAEEAQEDYYTSSRRAGTIAVNESNRISNYELQKLSMLKGYTKKRWHTLEDDRVRHDHRTVNLATVPIDEPFLVGGYQMMFPMDTQFDAPDDEIINCRCSVEYMK